MALEEQLNIIDHGLGERMLNHAFTLVNQWIIELGFGDYQSRMHQLLDDYNRTFEYYLSMDLPERDEQLDKLTHNAYMLVDEIYVELRLKRGLSPLVRGFNPDNIQSVMRYYASCIKFTEDDYQWLDNLLKDERRQGLALMTIASLAPNLLECFNFRIIMTLIDAISHGGRLVSDQALSTCILLLAHYDSRIDYFPQIQEAFAEAIGDGERAFRVLNAYIHTAQQVPHRLVMDTSEVSPDNAQDVIKNLIEKDFSELSMEDVITFMPEGEREFLAEVVMMLPNTWVFDTIVGEEEPEREHTINLAYLSIGCLDFMAEKLDEAEEFLISKIRSGNATAIDYVNYGHCCFIRGDRLMAYENYRQARTMCKSLKEFYPIFRPGRSLLASKDVPLDQIYLMEDHLVDFE